MSSPNNAYQSPQPVPSVPKPGARQLDYMRMYMYAFDNPNWIMNLLWLSLCILVAGAIPVVPYMVLFGYLLFLIESWQRQGHDRYADFDTARLGDYLSRGVWPILVALVASLVLAAVIVPVMLISFFAVMGIAASTDQPAFLLLLVLVFVLVNVLGIGANFFLMPMIFRAGLTQEFGEGFKMSWCWSFVKLVWVEMLLGNLFMMVGNFVLVLLGMALFCVGVYPASALTMLAWAHFQWQLYEIFLQRGGEPVPLKVQYLPPVQR